MPPENFTKILEQIPFSKTFRVNRDFLVSVDDVDGYLENEIRIRIETFVVGEHLADESYLRTTTSKWPATTWQMFKHTHAKSWWLGWLVRRHPVKFHVDRQQVVIRVGRYSLYPDATVRIPQLGSPVPFEKITEERYRDMD